VSTPLEIVVDPHPLLALAAFTAELPRPLDELASPPDLIAGLALDYPAPLAREQSTRSAVRDLLRYGGYKPTGRGKPASEYLVRAATDAALSPINLVVDACNVVSLHSGLPISVVDLERAKGPLSVAVARATSYVFNASGQVIDVDGLLCLHDAEGPCANAVKDSQRTKTHAATRRVVAVIWGVTSEPERGARAAAWYRELVERAGAATADVVTRKSG
jgi:DNA/RNA-binding domain of Phe-tRNA-synthetase-like protein